MISIPYIDMGKETYIKEGESMTLDELLHRMVMSWNPVYILYVTMIPIYWLSTPYAVYLPVYAG